MMEIKAIIFDFDGVLVESVDVKTQSFAEMYKPYGEDIVRLVTAYHLENGGISRYEKFRYYEEHLLGKSVCADNEKILAETFSKLVKDAVISAPFVPGAFEFLSSYRNDFVFFIASGTPEEELKEIVTLRGLDQFFIAVYGAPAKKEEIINEICMRHELEKCSVLMVGDSLSDYKGALAAGVHFVGRIIGNKMIFPSHIPVIPNLSTLYDLCLQSLYFRGDVNPC